MLKRLVYCTVVSSVVAQAHLRALQDICPLDPGQANPPSNCFGEDWELVAVDFQAFCTKRNGLQPCAGSNEFGYCPGPQEGLPFGSYCGYIKSGFSCVPRTVCAEFVVEEELGNIVPDPDDVPVPSPDASSPAQPISACTIDTSIPPLALCLQPTNGWTSMSVVGRDSYCTFVGPNDMHTDLCVADNAGGLCPLPQPGLPEGSVCQWIIGANAFGCVPNYDCLDSMNQEWGQLTPPDSPCASLPPIRTPSLAPCVSLPMP
jgi:hypothetical protein